MIPAATRIYKSTSPTRRAAPNGSTRTMGDTMTNQNMSIEQQTRKHSDAFLREYSVISQAAIGVIQVRTREPLRAIDVLRDFAVAEGLPFKVWTVLQGWQSTDPENPETEPEADGLADPYQALRAIGGLDGGHPFPAKGIFVMMNPHRVIPQHLGMVQLLKEYSRSFAGNHRRLIILTPYSFQAPEEIQDDITILDFDPPSFAELRESFDQLMEDVPRDRRPRFADTEKDAIIAQGAGMTKHEFENAVSRAVVTHRNLLPAVPVGKFLDTLAGVKTEVVKRSEVLELMEPTPIERIGGLDNLKDWILKRAHCFSQNARDFGVEPPKGIALIGPPGTGKSASAKAISSVLGLPLLKLDVGRVFQSLVGQSEARVRDATKMVDSMAPCVLMIDEADKAFQTGSGGDSGVGQRVLGTLLTWMQETRSPVFLVVTANRTQNLPSEFLRRGRLDEIFNVTTPNETERLEIIKIHLRIRKQDPDTLEGLEAAVEVSAGYVASEIEAAVKDAIIEAFVSGQSVTGALIQQQFQYMVPLSEAFREDFAAMEEWARNNARPASVAEGEIVGEARPRVRRRVQSAGTSAPGRRALTTLDS